MKTDGSLPSLPLRGQPDDEDVNEEEDGNDDEDVNEEEEEGVEDVRVHMKTNGSLLSPSSGSPPTHLLTLPD